MLLVLCDKHGPVLVVWAGLVALMLNLSIYSMEVSGWSLD